MRITLGVRQNFSLVTLVFCFFLNSLIACVFVDITGSGREHYKHVVAADGIWFGGAEASTDGSCPAHNQHSCSR